MKKTTALSALALLVVSVAELLLCTTANAQPGSLDTTFSTDGMQTTAIGSGNDYGQSVAIQSDGKLVVAGYSNNGANNDFAIARYNTDGTLDAAFGGGDGIQTTAIGSGNDGVNSVAIQSDGKLVVAGNSNNGLNDDFAIARYNTDGTLDTAFGGGDGIQTTAIGSGGDFGQSVAIQSDGKLVVAGFSTIGANNDFAIARYNTDGTLDTGFGGGDGIQTTAIGSIEDFGTSVAIQSDGKLVVAGYSNNGANDDFAIARYNTDGTLDLAFGGGDGIQTTAIGSSLDQGISVRQQADGKLVVAGFSYNGANYDFAIARYNTDGTLDPAFGGGDGIQTTAIGSGYDYGRSVRQQADGKLVVAGFSSNGANDDFAIARYNTDGTLDTGFGGGDGIQTTAIGSSMDQGISVAIQSDGKLVVAGYSNNGVNDDFAIVRYIGDCLPTYTDTIALILHDGINCIDYPIVKIGSQWWMKENVNATLYADNTPLVDGTAAGDITGNDSTKYYFNYNDSATYSDIYGKLYTWAAAMNGAASSDSIPSGVQGICPTGWHLPSDAEWKQLEMNLGMSQASADSIGWRGTDEGGKLKETGTTHWASPNTGATNTSGFTALPGGFRSTGGPFYNVGSNGVWWTAVVSSATAAWYRSLYSTEARVSRNSNGKGDGFSCRCVKDIVPIVSGLTISLSSTGVSCYGASDGSATVTATGGTTPYTYSWSTGGQTQSIASLQAGNYIVTVTDSAGSMATDSVTISSPPAINISITTSNATCGSNNGSAAAIATGGTPPYTYQWSSGDTLSTADSLSAGIYIVQVTDSNGCSNFAPAMVSNSGGVTVSNIAVTAVSCFGGSDGSAALTTSGGTQPYTYSWSNGAVSASLNGLAAGPYEVEITDATGCVTMAGIIVQEPEALTVLPFVVQPPTCGLTDGSAALSASGGTAPYTYLWSMGNTTETVGGIGWGIFSVLVTDSNGCQATTPLAVSNYLAPEITIDSVIEGTCINPNGSIYITVTGGSSPYIYSWSNLDTTEDITGLTPGVYELTLTDTAGCMAMASFTLPSAAPAESPVCLITVDSATGTNLLVWTKLPGAGIASYNIYKESTQAGKYYLIGNSPYVNESFFTDTFSNPNTRSWRYKIAAVDSCGIESELSTEHKTIHVTIGLGLNGNINLIWDRYQGFIYDTYYINRYTSAGGWQVIDSLPSNLFSYTDTSKQQGSVWYYIEVKHPAGCTAGKVKSYSSSKSNTSNAISTGGLFKTTGNSDFVRVYPNPGRGVFTVECQMSDVKCQMLEVRVYDVLGRAVYKTQVSNSKSQAPIDEFKIDLSWLPAGIYQLQVVTDKYITTTKLVVER